MLPEESWSGSQQRGGFEKISHGKKRICTESMLGAACTESRCGFVLGRNRFRAKWFSEANLDFAGMKGFGSLVGFEGFGVGLHDLHSKCKNHRFREANLELVWDEAIWCWFWDE